MISSAINRISTKLDSAHIPTQLAKLNQLAWGDDSLPVFVQFASLGPGRIIGHEEWRALPENEKDYILRSWNANGVAQHINTEGIFTMQATTAETNPIAYLMARDEYQFYVEDCRLRHSDMVRITVINVDSAREARHMAKQFLEDVKRFGLEIH